MVLRTVLTDCVQMDRVQMDRAGNIPVLIGE